MAAEYELDALVEYGVEDVSPEADRPNPSRRPLERALVKARAQVQQLQAELGAAMGDTQGSRQRTVRGFKIAHAKLRAELAKAEAEVERLRAELDQLPRRVSAAGLKTLKTEKKLIADTIKMTAYQVETRLLGMLRGVYCRTEDEGRTLLQAAFQSTGALRSGRESCMSSWLHSRRLTARKRSVNYAPNSTRWEPVSQGPASACSWRSSLTNRSKTLSRMSGVLDCDVSAARMVRNALAHNGGMEDARLRKAKVSHGIKIQDGVLQIMPTDITN